MNDSMTLTPAGKPNLRIDPTPSRAATPGDGGMFLAPDTFALRMPSPESAEAWQAADDARKLALATPGDQKRLSKAADRLAHAERAVAAAEAAHARAREAVVAMGVFGRPSSKAEETLTRAEASLAKAKRDHGIASDVVAALRLQIIESVRASLAETARAKLATAHSLYDDALARLGQTSALLDAMRTARRAEAVAAQELAAALGVTPGITNGQRADQATGSAYRTIPTDDLDLMALIVDKRPDPIRLEGGAVAAHLARRSESVA